MVHAVKIAQRKKNYLISIFFFVDRIIKKIEETRKKTNLFPFFHLIIESLATYRFEERIIQNGGIIGLCVQPLSRVFL